MLKILGCEVVVILGNECTKMLSSRLEHYRNEDKVADTEASTGLKRKKEGWNESTREVKNSNRVEDPALYRWICGSGTRGPQGQLVRSLEPLWHLALIHPCTRLPGDGHNGIQTGRSTVQVALTINHLEGHCWLFEPFWTGHRFSQVVSRLVLALRVTVAREQHGRS